MNAWNENSNTLPVRYGVPHVSLLGPLLFIIYINDIVKICKVMELILFLDDTNIFMSDNRLDIVNDKVNVELCMISTWFKINKISLNIKKLI